MDSDGRFAKAWKRWETLTTEDRLRVIELVETTLPLHRRHDYLAWAKANIDMPTVGQRDDIALPHLDDL